MQPRLLTAWLLFLSSYAPLGVIVAAIDFDRALKNFEHREFVWGILAVSAIAAVTPFAILGRMRGGVVYTVRSLSNRSGDLVGYALPYLATFIGLKLGELGSVVAFILFMLLFGALTIRTGALWINPLLALRGFRLYEASLDKGGASETTAFLLVRNELKIGQRVRADFLTADQLYVTDDRLDTATTPIPRDVRPSEED